MLVGYTIEVILLYILASNLENKFVVLFRKIIPKVLVPIVLFQTINSILKISEVGVTYGRYYVIMFGIFAFISGIVFSIMNIKKNGIVAAVLIILITISIVPPVDAFSISRVSQINKLESVLSENSMLVNNTIKPNSAISDIDKEKIIKTATYLDMMRYTKDISWMPVNFELYNDFEKTFGFALYNIDGQIGTSFFVRSNSEEVINISEYDGFVRMTFGNSQKGVTDKKTFDFIKNEKNYSITRTSDAETYSISLTDENSVELINFDSNQIFEKFKSNSRGDSEIPIADATFTVENSKAKITVVVQYMDMTENGNDKFYNSEIYVLANIK